MFKRFLCDTRGNFAVLTAIALTSMAGVAGLVVDYGNGLLNRLQDQRSADIVAMAGATIYASTGSTTSMNLAISKVGSLNGLPSSDITASLTTSPNGDGNQAVLVKVQTNVARTLSQILSSGSTLSVASTAYAELKSASGSGCILALDTTAHQAITISGSANVQAPGCDIVANSDNSDALDMSGSARATTPCTITVGGQTTTSGLTLTTCTRPTTNATATPDPYASLSNPVSLGASCQTLPNPPINVPPGYYCNGINISTTATFQPGFFYVKGNLAFQGGSNVSGTGVTFFIYKSGTTAISGSATVNISAPTSGTYAGVLLFGDRNGTTANNNNISGSSASVLQGTLYYPTQQVSYTGGSNSPSNCTEIIGDTITFSGTTYVGDNCAGTGVNQIVPAGTKTASLVQ